MEFPMKSIFKHTTMAILVSFGLSGCFLTGSSDTANKESTPTPVNQPSTPVTQPSHIRAVGVGSADIIDVKPEEIAHKLDKNGEEWRHIRVEGESRSLTQQGKSGTAVYYSWESLEGADDVARNHYIDLDEQGKFGQGGMYVGSVENIKIKDSSGVVRDKLNYLVFNQPYSSYGILFTENNTKAFYLGQRAGAEDGKDFEYSAGTSELDNSRIHENITWNDAVKGSATYYGFVIDTQNKSLDGTIFLKVNFVDGIEQSTASAHLSSKTVGNIDFTHLAYLKANGSFYFKQENGAMSGQFVGKDFNDAVGYIYLSSSDYDAVFGATKR